jgi:quercetin dioxygenase-like cupin family protein
MTFDHEGLELTFLTTAADSEGEVCRIEITVPPGSGALKHVHPRQEERFEILEGSFTIGVGRRADVYGPGETIVAPVGKVHWVSNESEVLVRVVTEVRPALATEAVWETLAALDREGRLGKNLIPRPLQIAVMMQDFGDSFIFVPGIPVALQKAIARPLAALGRRLGYKARQRY